MILATGMLLLIGGIIAGIVFVDPLRHQGFTDLISTVISLPTGALIAAPTAALSPEILNERECGKTMSTFNVGDTVVVDLNEIAALRLLTDYRGGANETVAQAYDNDHLEIVGGPVCFDNLLYWRVTLTRRGKSYTSWAAEADASGDPYMCPLDHSECQR